MKGALPQKCTSSTSLTTLANMIVTCTCTCTCMYSVHVHVHVHCILKSNLLIIAKQRCCAVDHYLQAFYCSLSLVARIMLGNNHMSRFARPTHFCFSLHICICAYMYTHTYIMYMYMYIHMYNVDGWWFSWCTNGAFCHTIIVKLMALRWQHSTALFSYS